MSQLISPHSVSPISTKNGRLTLSTNPSVVTPPVLSLFSEGQFQLETMGYNIREQSTSGPLTIYGFTHSR